jgi:hypothetical protein
MSHLHRVFSLRWCVSVFALLGLNSAALAQSTQALVLAFDDNFAVPLSPWTSVAIALVIAACALAFLRRRGASGFAQWCLLIATGGVLALLPPVPEADAVVSATPLVHSPTVITPLSCPLGTNSFLFQNATGHTTTIRGVTITGVGPCSIGLPPEALPGGVQQLVAPECTVGLPLAPSDYCVVTIFGSVG